MPPFFTATNSADSASEVFAERGRTGPATGWQRVLRAPWPWPVRVAAVLALYGAYFLLGGGLNGQRMPYDAGHYWELAVSFQRQHQAFSLLYFNDPTRGYCAALLQFPALVVRFLTHCTMPTAAKTVGVGWAVLLYALLVPALWRCLVPGGRVAGGRWLLLVLLAFAFWRDHFSFTMVDMPALALLLLALWAPSRAGLGWWLVAGLSLTVACNGRPVYVVAVAPVLALAGWWAGQHGRHTLARGTMLLVGVALVLGPQWAINRRHFQRNTPLVLARVNPNDPAPLYLKQLTWGTRVLRYDTGLHQRYIYADWAGLRVLRQEGLREYTSYGQFLSVAARHPLDFGVRYLRHLFNGLDVQQPAPYLLRDYGPWRHGLQVLNYTVLGLGGWLLIGWRRQLNWPRALTLLALLLPCMVALPTAVECRFLLPLHLLLLVVVAFQFPLRWRMPPRQGVAAVVLLGLWLVGCFALSAATFRTLQPDRGKTLVDD